MKIIQIIPSFTIGGAEIMCENLSVALSKLGHDVIVISMFNERSSISERLEAAGIKIYYLNKKLGLDPSMIFKMTRLFKYEKPKAIHTHLYCAQYAVPAAILSGIKHRVHTIHSIAQKEMNSKARRLNKWFYKHHRLIPVALSETVRETVITEYGIPKSRIPVIYNGVFLDKCITKNTYKTGDEITILHLGRLTAAKNHFEMIKAIILLHTKFPGVVLQIHGNGELEKEIKAFIKDKEAASYVKMCGTTNNVFPLLNSADIFILPSVFEGIPMALIEAMGTGLPIVAGNVGGIPDMICNGESGLLCEPNAEDIAKNIERLINNVVLREKCGKSAIMAAQKFAAQTMGERYCELYNRKK